MQLERATPLSANVPPKALINLLNGIQNANHELHNLMVVKSGKVILERYWQPYGPDYRHQLFSLSKSFTSTAVGFAVQEGLLTTDTKLSEIFTEEFETLGSRVDGEVRNTTVKNLLTMSTGMEYEGWGQGRHSDHVLSFLSSHIKDAPGKTFRYSSVSTFMCSAAVTRLTGVSVAEYLTPRLFEPLGIENAFWSRDENSGANVGGFGLYLTVEDIAKFGQFILQKGVWNGKQLLNAGWIEEATAKQIENGQNPESDWGCGYGYQFWRCIPHGVFRGDGMYGQYCVVAPEQDVVIAANSNADMQAFLHLLWKMLAEIKTLPLHAPDMDALEALNGFTHLTADKPGDAYPKLRAAYETEGKLKCYFDFNPRDGVFAVHRNLTKPPVCAFYFERGAWAKGAAPFGEDALLSTKADPALGYMNVSHERAHRVTTFGAWEGRVFHAVTWFYETTDKNELRCTFSEDFSEVTVEQRGGAYNAPFKEVYKGKRVRDC